MAKTSEATILKEARERGKRNIFSPIDESVERKNCKEDHRHWP